MTDIERSALARQVEDAGRFHGHVCAGIACGVRMAAEGLARLGIADPRGADHRRLLVLVEIDRCATDAIMIATGCTPGKRSLKILDLGKLAATFVDLEARRAVRVAAFPWPDRADGQPPDYLQGRLQDLFSVTPVEVDLRPEDLPGPSARRIPCARCGEQVSDGRDVEQGGARLCRPCAAGAAYYRPAAGGQPGAAR